MTIVYYPKDKHWERCYHQFTKLYYGSNRGINDTFYEICFKCKSIAIEEEDE